MAPTRAELTVKVRELERLRDAGQLSALGPAPTVAEWLRLWLETIAPRTASASTIETVYRPRIERWIIPAIGGHRLDRVRPEHLDALYLELAASGLSTKSVLMVHQILGRAYRMATRRGIVGRNVTTFVDPPRHREPEMSPLTADEARRILAAASEVPNSARWSVALALESPPGEALGPALQHVVLDRRRSSGSPAAARAPCRHASFRTRELTPGRHRLGCGPGCTPLAHHSPRAAAANGGSTSRRAEAIVPSSSLTPLPTSSPATAPARTRAAAAGPMWHDLDLVFTQPDGRDLVLVRDWEAWKDLLKRCRLPTLFASRRPPHRRDAAAGAGGRHPRLQEILGHSTLAVTKRYTHVTDTLARQAAERMGRALWD